MIEYEYSFKVKSLEQFIKYLECNGYEFIERCSERRTIYRNANKTMARITIKDYGDKIIKQLDFKDDKLDESEVKERRESLPIEYVDDGAILSILDFLCYKQDNTLIRVRTVYEKQGVKFEMDEYSEPSVVNVVAIEGDKELVDKIYMEVRDLEKEG